MCNQANHWFSFGSKKTSMKNLMYLYFWDQDIQLSDFLEKHPQKIFFSSEYFFFNPS